MTKKEYYKLRDSLSYYGNQEDLDYERLASILYSIQRKIMKCEEKGCNNYTDFEEFCDEHNKIRKQNNL